LVWNPVRSYLGARNTMRFLKRHARWWHWVYFISATAYHVPLEGFAMAMDHEEEYQRGFADLHRGSIAPAQEALKSRLAIEGEAADGAWRLLVTLPRAVIERHRMGRTGERSSTAAACGGLWNRPVDLRRLGLRP
jgi:hypothetical protein